MSTTVQNTSPAAPRPEKPSQISEVTTAMGGALFGVGLGGGWAGAIIGGIAGAVIGRLAANPRGETDR